MASITVGGGEIPGVELVIFDKDGTLIDLHHYWSGMIRMRAEYLAEKYAGGSADARRAVEGAMGLDSSSMRIRPEGPVGIKTRGYVIGATHRALAECGGSATEKDVSDAFVHIDLLSIGRIKELVRPLPGVPGFLAELRRNGVKMAVATTDITERAKLALSTIGIEGFFDFIAGGEMVARPKPAPDMVELVAGKLSVGKGSTVVVGDSIADLEMAANSGSGFIGVKTGLHNEDFIRRCRYLADDLEGIGVRA